MIDGLRAGGGLSRLLGTLNQPAIRQLLRYAFAGFCVTQLAAGIYTGLIYFLGISPFQANALSTVCGLTIGYLVHSRWSFAVGSGDGEHMQVGRFLLASSVAFMINNFWIWLLVGTLHLSPYAPVPMMMIATPCISFLLNRYWVFRAG